MEKLKISLPVIVEGKYDRLRLLNVMEAHIITTDGFGLFKKNEKAALIRALAKNSPVIVLTDSDGAGKLIRSHISGLIPPDRVIPLYTPRIYGKERRKAQASAEGVLGVEGMDNQLIYDLFAPSAGDTPPALADNPLSKTDFYIDGLSGGADSAARRDQIAAMFDLPPGMTANALLAALRIVCSYEQYLEAVKRNDCP